MKKEHRAKIMKGAWVFAKRAAEKFGGRAVEYIAGALKASWDNYKKHLELFRKKQEIRKNSVKVVNWFVRKNLEFGLAYNEFCNEIVTETEKAVLLELNPLHKEYASDQQWVPKSCIVK